MVSQAKIEANRRNAQRSTGPRTAQGKAAASRNALKHGLYSTKAVAVTENASPLDALRSHMIDEWRPASVLEVLLVERLAELIWQRRRVIGAKESLLKSTRRPRHAAEAQGFDMNLAVVRHMSGRRPKLLRIQACQLHLQNDMHRTLRELRTLQRARQHHRLCPATIAQNTDEKRAIATSENEQTNPIYCG